jgi:hypothetical protein
LNAILGTGGAVRTNGSDKHGVKPKTISAQHIGEQPIPHHGDTVHGQVKVGEDTPQGPPTGLSRCCGETDIELIGNRCDPAVGGVIAEEMQREPLLGIHQPSQNGLWKLHITPRKEGAIDIQNSRFNALRR